MWCSILKVAMWPVRATSCAPTPDKFSNLLHATSNLGMQPALALDAEETGVLGTHSRLQRLRGVGVANRHIALFTQRVVRQIVAQQVAADVFLAPVGQRMHFPAPILKFGETRIATTRRLIPTQSRKPGLRAEVIELALHGLDLGHAVVTCKLLGALLPQLAVALFRSGCAESRMDEVHIEIQPF